MITMTINKPATEKPTMFREGHCRITNPRNWIRLKLVQIVAILSQGAWAQLRKDESGNFKFIEPKTAKEKAKDNLAWAELSEELLANSDWAKWFKNKCSNLSA